MGPFVFISRDALPSRAAQRAAGILRIRSSSSTMIRTHHSPNTRSVRGIRSGEAMGLLPEVGTTGFSQAYLHSPANTCRDGRLMRPGIAKALA